MQCRREGSARSLLHHNFLVPYDVDALVKGIDAVIHCIIYKQFSTERIDVCHVSGRAGCCYAFHVSSVKHLHLQHDTWLVARVGEGELRQVGQLEGYYVGVRILCRLHHRGVCLGILSPRILLPVSSLVERVSVDIGDEGDTGRHLACGAVERTLCAV